MIMVSLSLQHGNYASYFPSVLVTSRRLI